MFMDNVVRLSKLTKFAGIFTIVLFSLIAIGMFITGNIGEGFCFMPFVFVGIALLLSYKKQTIVVNDNELVFNYVFKKSQYVNYKDIHCVLLIPLNNRTQAALIDKNYNRITTLDAMLSNSEVLYAALENNGVMTVNFEELLEQGKDVSKYVNVLNWAERNYYQSAYIEHETVTNMSKSNELAEINRTKKNIKIFGWLLILADVIAYFVGGRGMVIILMFVILVTYAMYIKYYPYIYMEVATKKGQENAYQLPFIGSALALLLSIHYSKLFNYDFVSFIKIMLIIALLLAIPFLVKSSRTNVSQRFTRKLSVIFAAFLIAFSITFPVNLLLTFDQATHETGIVTDKHIGSGQTRDKELYVNCNGRTKIYTVSRSEYENTLIGDTKVISTQKSILGLEYSSVDD